MQLWNSLWIAFSMYSRIPVPRADWDQKKMHYVMCFFPLVGLVIGGIMWLAQLFFVPLTFGKAFDTVVLVLLPVILTGGIHMDGFLDTVDARSSFASPEKKLEILKDAHTGAFAVIGAALYFLADYGIWSEVTGALFPVLSLSFVLSRVLSGYTVITWKHARKEGLAADFREAADQQRSRMALRAEGAVVVIAMALVDWRQAVAAVAAAVCVLLYYRRTAYREFGGMTGDLAGWFLQLCELAMAGSLVLGDAVWY